MSFPERKARHKAAAAILFAGMLSVGSAHATLPEWLQHVAGATSVESALFRVMQLPTVQALYPRPPKEAQAELARLINAKANDAELYQLRARADEQALDAHAAEADWKLYVSHAKEPLAARLELADFYHRRLETEQELDALAAVAQAPPLASEAYANPEQQRSWLVFDRMLLLETQQGLPAVRIAETFDAFLKRYPEEPLVYAAALNFLLDQHDFRTANGLVGRYRSALPADAIFPIRASALIASRRGHGDDALAIYDHAFQPLWPRELIGSYLSLLAQTHRLRVFEADARVRLREHPDGPEALNALARLFFYDQQAGRMDAAQRTIDQFRMEREARHGAWTAEDLGTLAALSASTSNWAEAARYNFALSSSTGTLPGGEPAAQAGLASLIHILLSAPDAPLPLVSQNLTMYRDMATLDQGPGYWNGILSLWLNGTSPENEYANETAKAQGYFHRAKAAELLTQLDQRFPGAPERPALHAELLHALVAYGEPAAIVKAGKQFLANFPTAPERLDAASLLADAYARQNDTASEFALYDALLAELSAKTQGLPLTAAGLGNSVAARGTLYVVAPRGLADPAAANGDPAPLAADPAPHILPAATAYAQVLDRSLGRLVTANQLPRALTVLRAQLDRNPNESLLYERLASFLQQNNFSAQQEQVYESAAAHFQEPTWRDKLARLYLRERKARAFATLTRQVTDLFSGTELDAYFRQVTPGQPIGPQLALDLNLYAAKRFPHDLVFTRNLLRAYQVRPTRDSAAYEALLRRHWWESPELRDEFLTYLSRTGKLQSELATLEAEKAEDNPAADREQAELEIFSSHFEQAAPHLASVAALYPADADTGDRAVSLFRSLAYLDPTRTSTAQAARFEDNLLSAEPGAPDAANRLATRGDLYAEATSTGGEDLASATPIWHRIPELHPGSPQGFLSAATIFWDYFQFNEALAELAAARERFHAPALFAYEAGAIEENRHDLNAAVAEYATAVLHPIPPALRVESARGVLDAWFKPPSDEADSNLYDSARSLVGSNEAYQRLLTLARRPASAAAVDKVTAQAVATEPASSGGLTLRADVLGAQRSEPELTTALTHLYSGALDQAQTLEEATSVGALAQSRNLTAVYERALMRQAELTPDPVQKMQLEFALASSLESHKDLARATRVVDAALQANPRVLGVVRNATDFFVRIGQPGRVVATLIGASRLATPALARDFTLEAATRANDAGKPQQGRALALTLLPQSPYDAPVLALIADSYAREQDDAGLKRFYLDALEKAQHDPALMGDARRQDVALLRRGLIPALTRLKEDAGVVDQYAALLSAYPEDAATAQQAALYALAHGRQPQLLEFLRTTVAQSPRDSRFAVLLGQVEATFEDLPAAEKAYSAAIAIRKDRVDLYTARVDLELRLSPGDAEQSELAAADFSRLYQLTYHDSAWMVRLAELRARQRRPADVVAALETAYITGHPQSASDDMTVAAQLERWNLLAEARTFAEQGRTIAGDDFLLAPDLGATYARILTRLGHASDALSTLLAAQHAAKVSASSPAALAVELARQTISEDEAKGFRESFAANRRQQAQANLDTAIQAIGETVENFYTPEQKRTYAEALDKVHSNAPGVAVAAAAAAGLVDREADWRAQILLHGSRTDAKASLQPYIALQQNRLAFNELARTLEGYALLLKPVEAVPLLERAARAYRDAGDTMNELRLTRSLTLAADPGLRDRFFDLLLGHDADALTALASSEDGSLADAAVNYVVANSTKAQALETVARRGQTLPPVWQPASAALVMTYFASTPEKPVDDLSSFTRPLAADASIGDRIGHAADPKNQIVGDDFFFYASRFGIYLASTKRAADAESWLPGQLELAPGSPAPYLDLARSYTETKNIPAALSEYGHALELTPANPAIEDALAQALWSAGRRPEAAAHWYRALGILRTMQEHAQYPESFFSDFATIARHVGAAHCGTQFQADFASILSPYLAKNGSYRSNELLRAVYLAAATPEEGTELILRVSDSAKEPEEVLAGLSHAAWLKPEPAQAILERRLTLASRMSLDASGSSFAVERVLEELLNLYLAANDFAKAGALLDSVPKAAQAEAPYPGARILIAAHAGRVDALLASFRAAPEQAPPLAMIREAANALEMQKKPDHAGARALREFVFHQQELAHELEGADFLALAQSRLDTGDVPGALTLLNRLSLQPNGSGEQNANANTDSAAALLEAAQRPAEAVPFLRALVAETPWNSEYRLRLALAQEVAAPWEARQNLVAVASDAQAPYSLRVRAARRLTAAGKAELGSRDLALIAHPQGVSAARQPYFDQARIAAAQLPGTSPTDRESLLREAIAIAPLRPETTPALLNLLLAQGDHADPSVTLALLRILEEAPLPTGRNATPGDVQSSGLPRVADSLDPAARLRLAALVSSAYEREHDLTSALRYAKAGIALTSTPDAGLRQRRDALQTQLRLAERNTARRPLLQDALGQAVPVRPRLTASTLSPEDDSQ